MPEQARYTVKAPNGQTYSFNARAGLNRRQAEAALERAVPAAFQQSYTVRADDGQTYRFNAREGMSQSEARRALHRAVPETDRDRNAIGAGWAAARTALTTGLPYALDAAFGIVTPEEEARYRAALQESARIQEERLPGGAPSIGDMTSGRSDFFGGLMENLGQSIPQAVPAVIGGIGGAAIGTAVAPGPGTLAGGIGGVLGGVGASAPFFAGSNVARATEGGQTALTRDAAGRALAVAPLQAGADVLAAKFIPGLNRVFGGPVTNTALANLARPGLARGAVRIGQGAVAGGAAEAGQQFGERYAAGLPLGDPEAMREYGESAALGAIMDASIGVAGAPFSGRRDGAAPTPVAPSPAGTPPPATDFGTEEDTVAITREVETLAPEQRAVFDVEYARIIDEGLVTSEKIAAGMALDVAKRVPVTTTQGTEDAASVGQPSGAGVSGPDVRGELDGTPAGPEGVAAGDVGRAGSPLTVDVQGEGDVNAPLTPPKGRRGKAAAVAPAVEGENLTPTAAAELAAPVTQTPTAPTVEAEAPAAVPDVATPSAPKQRAAKAISPDVQARRDAAAAKAAPAPVAEAAPVTPAADEAPSAPPADLNDTRGKGVQYHGTPKPITKLEEGYYNDANIYGGQEAFYTTDALDIAKGYGRKSPTAVGYAVTERAPVNFFDMEAAKPVAEWRDIFKYNNGDIDSLLDMALEELGDSPNLREIMDEMRDSSQGEGLSRNDTQDIFTGMIDALAARGFGGMEHVGGLKTKRAPHKVKIYFRPWEQVDLSPTSFDGTPPPVAPTSTPAPTVEPVAETPPAAPDPAAVMQAIESEALAGIPAGPVQNAFLSGASARLFGGEKDVAAALNKTPEALRPVVQQGADIAANRLAAPEAAPAEAAKGKGKRGSIAKALGTGRMSVDRVQNTADRVVAGWKNAPPVIVVATSSDVPGNTDQTLLKGQYDGKNIYIVADTHNDAADVQATVYHESLVHAGLRQELGRKLYEIFDAAIKSNPQMAAAADKWLADNPEAYTQYNERTRRAIALEEVLADTPIASIKKVPAMARVWARLRDAFRSVGRLFGARLSYNDADIQALLQRARDNIVSGGRNRSEEFSATETRDARAKKAATPAAPLTPADRAAARSLEETKAVVTEATKKFAASDPVANPKKAADPNYAAGNISTAMPFLEKAWRTMSTPAFKKWLEVMPLSRMAEWGDKNVPGLTKLYHLGTQKIGQLHNYQRRFNDITKQLVAVANKYGQETISKVAYYTRINRVDVTELGDTLAASYNADKPLQWYAAELAKKGVSAARKKRLERAALLREAEVREVHELWQQLGDQKGGREAFLATQKFYKTMYNALRALNYSAMRRLNVSEQTQKELRENFDSAIEGEPEEATGMPKNLYPREYVPAKRFGEFWLNIEADTSKDNKRQRIFATFDTAGERDAELQRLSEMYGLDKSGNDADGTRVVKTGNSMKSLQDAPDVRGTMLEKLFNTLDTAAKEGADLPNKKQVDALKKELFNTWLMSSSANSLQRNFVETKELVAGFSQDLSRVFGDSAMQYASLLSAAEYDRKIESQIDKLRGDIEEQHAPDDQSRYRMFVDEMENRLVQDYAAQNGPNMFNSINRAMFFYFLTAPATAAAQWVQLPGVMLPFLGAEYGYGKATAAFTKNLNFAKTLGTNETNALGEKVFSLPSMRNSDRFKNDPLFRRAYLAGAGRAVFETMVDVITSSAATPTRAKTKGALVKNVFLKTNEVVTGTLSAVYTTSELVTREVAYMAAFDLHYAKTGDFEASVDAAVTATNKSMGSYLDIERPTFMKYSAIRSLTAFKQYAIAMTSLYMDLVAKIATSKGERITAAKQLAGITAMGALLGGVPGTMVFGLIGSTFGIAMKAALDDEEKEAIRAEDPLVNPLDNFEAWFRRKWLPETYGTGLGDIVENGVISELTGADFASRLSNSNMWWRDGKPGETPSQDILNAAAANIPPLSMAMSVADATKDFSEGRVLRGTAKITPAFLRGGVNAILLNKQGVESPTTGDTSIEPGELNMADIVSQTLGFVPMKVSDFRKESFAFQGARTEAGRAKTRVMGNLYRVLMDANAEPGQLDRAIAAIERHNMRYPAGTPYFIDENTLMTSLERQESSDERTYRGMMLRDEEQRLAPLYEADR